MNTRQKLNICLTTNGAILGVFAILMFQYGESTSYWQYGYNDNLTLFSIKINTVEKYLCLLFLISVINVSKVMVDNIAIPILNFSIYNPDKKHITDLSKQELILFGNSIYLIANLRRLVLTLISVSQLDLALWSLLSSQMISGYVIHRLLNEKTFSKKDSNSGEDMV